MTDTSIDNLRRRIQERSIDEQIVLFFAALGTLIVLPFLVLRIHNAQWLAAATDAVIVTALLAAIGYVVYTGRSVLASYAVIVPYTLGMVAIVHLQGEPSLSWAFPATTATFFLIAMRWAAVINVLACVAIAPVVLELGSGLAAATFYAALALTNFFAGFFASWMRRSRARFMSLAEHDALTGIGNRRAMNRTLTSTLEVLASGGPTASLLVADIDHFKRFNDAHGHDAGDELLVELTDLMRGTIRASDDLFRYGGEEFVVVAYGTRASDGRALAEKLRRRVATARFVNGGTITVSVGIAEARPGDTPEQWFRRADQGLLEAKRAGRDRVSLHVSDVSTAERCAHYDA